MSLFKYYPPDRVKILNNLLIRYTPPNEFNDALDSIPAVKNFTSQKQNMKRVEDLLHSKYFEYISDKNTSPTTIEQFKARFRGEAEERIRNINSSKDLYIKELLSVWRATLDKFGILCLCKNDKSAAMWAHYAYHNKGFLIELDEKHEFFKLQKDDRIDVHYEDHRTPLNYDSDDYDSIALSVFKNKSKEWSYEDEVRFVQVFELYDTFQKDSLGKNTLIKIPPTCIKSITTGLRAEESTIKSIEDSLSRHELSHVKGYHAEIDIDLFKINRIEGLRHSNADIDDVVYKNDLFNIMMSMKHK